MVEFMPHAPVEELSVVAAANHEAHHDPSCVATVDFGAMLPLDPSRFIAGRDGRA
jgi:hypothetical protein